MKIINLLILGILFSFSSFANGDYPHAYGAYVEINYDDKHAPVRPEGSGHEAVTDKYGRLVVQEGDFTAQSEIMPWSSWWYPRFEKTLFEDNGRNNLSPLSKYDRFARKSGQRRANARSYEEENIYKDRAVDWSGLCDAWALASIMEEEPKKSVRKKGILFNVRDLKSLLIKSYEKTDLKGHFGQRNDGAWDHHYEDVYPDQFHKFFQVELFKRKMPFIMDYDAGVQVWNVPVYKVKTKIKRDPRRNNIVNVKTFVWYASPFIEDHNFVGIRSIMKFYDYNLFGRWTRRGFEVNGGQWMESARRDHPDFLIARPDSVKRGSFNKELQVDIIDKILKGRR